MLKRFILYGFMLASVVSNAQSVTPAIINTSGTSTTLSGITFEFNLGEDITTTITNNTMITQGFLQPMVQNANGSLPVLGLDFTAKRVNSQQVQLDWKTQQEIANKGFTIQRKKETGNSFIDVAFEKSKALSGNSATPLTYTKLDTNNYSGRTYYRIKQEDLNGTFTYSIVRIVNGDVGKAVTIKAWPIPAPKEFSVVIMGIQKDILLLYDATGNLIRQANITEGNQVKITGLSPGTYFIKLKSQPDLTQKITVQ